MNIKTLPEIDLPLVDRMDHEATAAELTATTAAETAAAVLALWDTIGVTLIPILGPLGFSALRQRSVSVARAQHPWLVNEPPGFRAPTNMAPLLAAISRQDDAEAARGAQTVFASFHDLLTALVGPSLTERLLSRHELRQGSDPGAHGRCAAGADGVTLPCSA